MQDLQDSLKILNNPFRWEALSPVVQSLRDAAIIFPDGSGSVATRRTFSILSRFILKESQLISLVGQLLVCMEL